MNGKTMRHHNVPTLVITTAVILLTALTAHAAQQGIFFSPHNFSASRQTGDPIFGSSEERICIFCHTPHHANAEGPLWSRDVSNQDNYKMYESPTLTATVSLKPTGASRLCLSCHDGTIAIGALQGGYILTPAPSLQGNPNQLALLDSSGRHDLSGDHPISFAYPVKQDLVVPQSIQKPVTLSPGSRVECTACHNPHNNEYGKFLVVNNIDGVKLCTSCHLTPGWMTTPYSAHKINITSNNQGCGTCHQSHKSPGQQYILKNGPEELNCLTSTCHATVASAFNAGISKHPVINQDNLVHKPNEALPASQKHVKCADCHSPHQANNLAPPSPLPLEPRIISNNGPLSGVRGINSSGSETAPAKYEYEVCFRCHAGANAFNFIGSYGPSPFLPFRQVSDPNELNRFAITNASYHPVVQVTRQSPSSYSVQSLITPTPNLIIYCSDCHASHGAAYPHLFRDRYETQSLPGNSSFNYALCFRCHKDSFSGSGFPYHQSHVYPTQPGRQPAPCSACHDPHGVAATPHLINFDRNLLPNPNVPPLQRYVSLGVGRGSCTVSCHTTGSPDIYTHVYP